MAVLIARTIAVAVLVLFGGCVLADVDLSGLPCPCSGADYVCDVPTNSCVRLVSGPFTLGVNPAAITVRQGRTATISVDLDSTVAQSVSVKALGLPSGVLASPLLLTPKQPRGDLLLTSDTSAAIGTSVVKLEGTGPTGDKQTRDFMLTIGGRPGTLDNSFGDKGLVTVPGISLSFFPRTVITPDDRIVIVTLGNGVAYLLRLLPDGMLDSTFGTSGITTVPSPPMGPGWTLNDVVLQPDGKIIVVGATNPASNGILWRFDSTGHLDPTFGSQGMVSVSFGATQTFLTSVAVRADGRLVIAGYTGPSFDMLHGGVTRRMSDGAVDSTFGTNGITLTAFGSDSDYWVAVMLLPDQRIVVAGLRTSLPRHSLLVRYSPDGALDTGFATNGYALGDANTTLALLRRGPGDTVLAGGAFNNGTGLGGQGVFVSRYLASGALDPGFGTAGISPVKSTQPPSTDVAGLVPVANGGFAVFDRAFFTEIDVNGTPDAEVGIVAASSPMVFSDADQQSTGRLVVVGGTFAGILQVARYWP